MKTRIAIHQTYRVERRIVVEVEAAAHHDAGEMLADTRIDIPTFDDPRWSGVRRLKHEDYRLA